MLKKIILVALVIVLIAGFIFYKKYNKPHINISEAKPDISLDSSFLKNSFLEDEDAANAKYLDQIIQVKGTVLKVSSERGKAIITLGEEDAFGNISCHMLENTPEQENLKAGQNVVVKGICTGYLLDVILVRCVLIN